MFLWWASSSLVARGRSSSLRSVPASFHGQHFSIKCSDRRRQAERQKELCRAPLKDLAERSPTCTREALSDSWTSNVGVGGDVMAIVPDARVVREEGTETGCAHSCGFRLLASELRAEVSSKPVPLSLSAEPRGPYEGTRQLEARIRGCESLVLNHGASR